MRLCGYALYICMVLGVGVTAAGCLRSPIVEVRDQRYATMETVVAYSIAEIEENLVYYYSRCKHGRWMKPAKEGEPRQMVWGKQMNAREFRVDAWMDFEPMGVGRTLVKSHFTPQGRAYITKYLQVIQNPSVCRK